MSKLKKTSNWRVVCEPKPYWGWVDHEKQDAETIANEIRERISDVVNVRVECDSEDVCSHCGRVWEEYKEGESADTPAGLPKCCTQAQAEWEDEHSREEA